MWRKYVAYFDAGYLIPVTAWILAVPFGWTEQWIKAGGLVLLGFFITIFSTVVLMKANPSRKIHYRNKGLELAATGFAIMTVVFVRAPIGWWLALGQTRYFFSLPEAI